MGLTAMAEKGGAEPRRRWGPRPERSGGPEAKGNFASGARRPPARKAQRAGENSQERRVLALTDGHRKTPMQPGLRLDRRVMRIRAFAKPENPRRGDHALSTAITLGPSANYPY